MHRREQLGEGQRALGTSVPDRDNASEDKSVPRETGTESNGAFRKGSASSGVSRFIVLKAKGFKYSWAGLPYSRLFYLCYAI